MEWWLRLPALECCASHPYCEVCGKPAVDMLPHHKFPKCRENLFRGDIHRRSNLARVCRDCHELFHNRLGQPSPRKVQALLPEARRLVKLNPKFMKMMPSFLVKAVREKP